MNEADISGNLEPVQKTLRSFMCRMQDVVGWTVFLTAVAAMVMVLIAVWLIPARVSNGYAEWATAESVTMYHLKYKRLPVSWNEFKNFLKDQPEEERSKYLSPETRDKLESVITIDFSKLVEIEQAAKQEHGKVQLPRAIQVVKGKRALRFTEPNELIYEYFRAGEFASSYAKE